MELDLILPKFDVPNSAQRVPQGIICLAANDEAVHFLAVFCKVLSDPSNIPEELANGLIAFQLDYQPARLASVLRQQVDPANITRVLVPGFFVAGLLVERPLFAELDPIPVVAQELVEMTLKTESLLALS